MNAISLCLSMSLFAAATSVFPQEISAVGHRSPGPRVAYSPTEPIGAYLGQKAPGMTPEKFGPDFISSVQGDEYSICFSPDSNEIYFSRSTPNVSNTIWWTHRINNVWTTPEKAPFTGTYYNSEPFITPSNQKMFFVSTRDGTTIFQLWTMNRSGTNWGTPQQLGAPISNKNKMGPTAASNGNLYYSQLDDDGRSYFYMARNNAGVFDAPVKLSAAVNAFYFQAHLFVAPDESYIVFDAIPTQQSTGSSIYASFKKNDGTWGNAIKLGSAINSTDNQYLPYVSPDGKYLFFTKNGDLWWVDAKAVTDLKPVGVIRNEREGMPEIFQLRQNYPNPFNPATMIRYALPSFAHVSLTIHDMLGREIAVLVNGEQPAGWKEEQWNAANVASGMYLCRLQADEFVETKRLILVK